MGILTKTLVKIKMTNPFILYVNSKTDLFLPRNSKSFSDISVTELICFLTLNESKAKPNNF